jgi:uncharacterized protein YkwD
MRRIVAALGILAVTGLGAAPLASTPRAAEPEAAASPSPTPDDFWSHFRFDVEIIKAPPPAPEPDPTAARRLLALTNAERARRNLPLLRWWPEGVAEAARIQTDKMVESRHLFHTSNLRRLLYTLRVQTIGENVGVGPSLEGIERAFMRSREHRENILDREYRMAGIWVVRDPGGLLWVTVTFGSPLPRR